MHWKNEPSPAFSLKKKGNNKIAMYKTYNITPPPPTEEEKKRTLLCD